MITKEFYDAVLLWNKQKNFHNFKTLYKNGFERNPWFGFRLWRIFKNTITGRYKNIEKLVKLNQVKIKEVND